MICRCLTFTAQRDRRKTEHTGRGSACSTPLLVKVKGAHRPSPFHDAQGAVVRQAEDRAHRRGQRLPVNVYFLCAKGTSDDRRYACSPIPDKDRGITTRK